MYIVSAWMHVMCSHCQVISNVGAIRDLPTMLPIHYKVCLTERRIGTRMWVSHVPGQWSHLHYWDYNPVWSTDGGATMRCPPLDMFTMSGHVKNAATWMPQTAHLETDEQWYKRVVHYYEMRDEESPRCLIKMGDRYLEWANPRKWCGTVREALRMSYKRAESLILDQYIVGPPIDRPEVKIIYGPSGLELRRD